MKTPEEVAKLQELLETPLDPNLDYFDATASIEAIAEHIRGLHTLIQFLAKGLVERGESILALRAKLIELEGDMAAAGIGSGAPKSKLVGFDTPKLEMN